MRVPLSGKNDHGLFLAGLEGMVEKETPVNKASRLCVALCLGDP